MRRKRSTCCWASSRKRITLWQAGSIGEDSATFPSIVVNRGGCLSAIPSVLHRSAVVNVFAAFSVTKLKIGQIALGEIPFLFGLTPVFFLAVSVRGSAHFP
jgi:C4-dicarboxylate transporter DctM subunit